MMKEKINVISVKSLCTKFELYEINLCVKSECLQDFLNYIEHYKKNEEKK